MSRQAPYIKQHEQPNGPGDSRPTALQIIKDEGLEGKWAGKVVAITGCSPGGIGPETARAIHATGADIFILSRDLDKANAVATDILSSGTPGKVEVIKADLSSLESIREAAKELEKRSSKLHVLINNAAIMACPKGLTADGFESQIGTNHFGHFLLFQLLKPILIASSTPEFNSRVVAVSSLSHRTSPIQLDDLNFENTPYDAWKAYGQSKLANVLFANELDRRYSAQGVHALSVHPGVIETELQRYVPELRPHLKVGEVGKVSKNVQQGAATTVWAAVSNSLEGKGGVYLEDVSEALPAISDDMNLLSGHSPSAYDPETEKKLWVKSLELVGLGDDSA
ncbi:short-chain dehydrogenase [Paramyrothecium foliicola]|nr:short-chain dehydrogenase [Paramyrothecium foliicola]